VFIGHFGVGFAATRVVPRVSLGLLFLAAQFIDLLWPTLLLLGVERVAIAPGITIVTPLDFQHYPVSHSLLGVGGWAVLVGGAYLVVDRRAIREAVLLALLVVSHWLLDLIVHRPDLPVTFTGDARLGLGLWNSMAATLLVEGAIFIAGVWLYTRATRARGAVGRWALWGLVAFLLVVYAANLLGDPPPSTTAIAWIGHAQWLLVLWGFWIDRHRVAVETVRPAGQTGAVA
jgi:hypothetical protein